jgi:hypothetical protein
VESGRPTFVPASHAAIGPSWPGAIWYTSDRPSTNERRRSTSPFSRSSRSCRLTAGRLRPISRAIDVGRSGRIANSAMIRRRVGSARSSIPRADRFGTEGSLPTALHGGSIAPCVAVCASVETVAGWRGRDVKSRERRFRMRLVGPRSRANQNGPGPRGARAVPRPVWTTPGNPSASATGTGGAACAAPSPRSGESARGSR